MPPNPPKVSRNFLQKKQGPLPVWAWAALGLGAAYAYSRYKANKAAASTTPTTATSSAGEPAGTPPEFVIENNMPAINIPQAPVSPVATAPPVATPPGTSPSPPVTPPLQGGNPPRGPGGPVSTAPPPAPPTTVTRSAAHYIVHAGDTLSSIASRNGTTWQALWTYNTTPGNRPAQTIATLKARGPNLLYSGETILIPPK